MKFTDQIGRTSTLTKNTQRIVSLVPSITELLVDLDLENELVGVTKFCVHPKKLKEIKTIVGGTKNIKKDVLKALNPTIILCNKEENTAKIVSSCEQIAPTHVSNIITIDDTLTLIEQYGMLFSKVEKAAQIIEKINQKRINFHQFISKKEAVKAAYFIWRKPWMVAGNNTFINHLLALNKFENSFKNTARYPEIELQEIRQKKDLKFIFLSSEPYPFKEEHSKEISKYIKPTTKIIFVDGEFFSWYGSRLIKAFDYFKKLHQRI